MFVASPTALTRLLMLVAIVAAVLTLLWASSFGADSTTNRRDAGVRIAGVLAGATLVAWWLGALIEVLRGRVDDRLPRRERQLGNRERLLAALAVDAPSPSVLRSARSAAWVTSLAAVGGWGAVLLVRGDVVPGVALLAAMPALALVAQLVLAGPGVRGETRWLARIGMARDIDADAVRQAHELARAVEGGTLAGTPTPQPLLGGRRPDGPIAVWITDAQCVTVLVADTGTSCTVAEDGGRLTADDQAPALLRATIDGLRGARRWRGVRLRVVPGGVVVTRELWNRARSPWVADIWLAELVLHELSAAQATRPAHPA